MRRRSYLASLTTGMLGVAGCLGQSMPGVIDREFRNLDASVEKIFPAHQYYFYLTGTDEDPESAGKEPIDYADLESEVKEVIRQIREPGPVGFDDPPAAVMETAEKYLIICGDWCSRSHKYAKLYYLERDPAAPPLAALDAEVTEAGTGIDVTLTNADDEPFVVFSGAGPPFGALKAVGINGTDHVIELWSPSFGEDDSIKIRDGSVFYPDIGVTTEFAGGEAVTRTYELTRQLTDEFVEGTYVLSPRSDASGFVQGEQTDIPFPVEYYRPDDHREKEIVDFRVIVELL